MNTKQFEREKAYSTASIINNMLFVRGIISESDKHRINRLLIKKYRPVIGELSGYNARAAPKDTSEVM